MRVARLREAGVALWDVIGQCEREGSLDSAIRGAVANDFAGFFTAHPHLRLVLFNGAKAADTFARRVPACVLPTGVECIQLPSTSPANRAQATEAKRAAWRQALRSGGACLR